jgi:hypothetical protein
MLINKRILINIMTTVDGKEPSVPPRNLGSHYGFHRNPYDPSPLAIESGDSDLFIGREKEGLLFRTFLESFDRGAIFVEGGTGVGKTSFANVQEYRSGRGAHGARLLPTLQPIQLASTLNPTEFLLSVVSNVLSSLQYASPSVQKEASFRKLSLSVNQSLIRTRSWEITAAGFGGGTGTQVTTSNPLLVLLPYVSDLLDQAARLSVDRGFHRIVVNVNNLDVIDPQNLVSFLDSTRDLTLTRTPFLWVFIGPIGGRALVAQRSRRVSELIRTDPVWLPPLSLKEVREAVEARVTRYRTHAAVSAPVSREIVDLLYESSSGEVRYLLNRCTDLLLRTMIEFPTTRTISLEVALPMLREMTAAALERCNLTSKQSDVLRRIANHGPCQPKEHRSFGFASAPGFLRYLARFYELGLVDRRRRGKEVVYTPRGDVVLALKTAPPPISGRGS